MLLAVFVGNPSPHTIAQQTFIDSLKKNITAATSLNEKLPALQAFCDQWESFNPDTLLRYALFTRNVAHSLKNSNAIMMCDYYLAACLFQKNKLDSALNAINAVFAAAGNKTQYNSSLLKFYLLKTNILMRTLRYEEALKLDLEILPLAEKNNDTIGIIRLSTGIGNVNLRLKKTEAAIKWHYKAIACLLTDELRAKAGFVYINLAVAYYHLAVLNDTRQNEDSIEINLQKAIKYSRLGNNLTNLANSLSMYGKVLAEYKKTRLAEVALREAVETRKKIGDIYYVITDMTALSSLYENNNQIQKGIAVCMKALVLARQNRADASSLVGIYSSLGELYQKAGDYHQYSEVLNKRMELLDSMYKMNSEVAIGELETKYHLQKKENTILQQSFSIARKNYIIYSISGLGLLSLVIVLIVLQYKRHKQAQKIKGILLDNEIKTHLAIAHAKEEERKRIIADLHDDVGGGLSTIRMISDLISTQTDHQLKLGQYAIKISGIAKEVTQRMNTIVWALNTENDTLQNLSEYIREYGFSFFEDTAIEFKSNLIDAGHNVQLSGLQRKNLFLAVKECLNNVYKHSLAKNTWIDIELSGNLLLLKICDDGKGINHENPFGNGVKNIQKRMKEINGTVLFNSENGTCVQLMVDLNTLGPRDK